MIIYAHEIRRICQQLTMLSSFSLIPSLSLSQHTTHTHTHTLSLSLSLSLSVQTVIDRARMKSSVSNGLNLYLTVTGRGVDYRFRRATTTNKRRSKRRNRRALSHSSRNVAPATLVRTALLLRRPHYSPPRGFLPAIYLPPFPRWLAILPSLSTTAQRKRARRAEAS